MPKSCKILFSEQAPTQYFTAFCRMAELLQNKMEIPTIIYTIEQETFIIILVFSDRSCYIFVKEGIEL